MSASGRPELEALLSACDHSLEGLRDKALLLFGFASGGRRRSEIAAADWQDLHCIGEDALQAGLNGDFAGHSLRSGFIT